MAAPFRHRTRVRFNECDPQGVVFYANYLVVSVTRVGATSAVVEVAVERADDGERLVEGELRHVFVDATSYRKREIPPHAREGLARYLADPAREGEPDPACG